VRYERGAVHSHHAEGKRMLITAKRLFHDLDDSIVEDPLIEVLDRANTSVAAAACGIGDRKGTISIGKDADLLAVAGDPLDDISCIEQVRAVFVKGNPVRLTPPAASAHG
jgi:cytosine/adenosine deaminase-related metal-dependent hydrolase